MAAPCFLSEMSGDEFREMDHILLKNMVYKKVQIFVAEGYQYQGWLYTVDPVSQSVLLAQCDDVSLDGQIPITMVMGENISSIAVIDEDTSKHKTLLNQLFKSGTQSQTIPRAELSERKQKLKEWLELHRVPVKECGEENESLSISDVLVIEPPYTPENCLCKNEIILARVQALVRNMEDAS